jgi:hypothetical protein
LNKEKIFLLFFSLLFFKPIKISKKEMKKTQRKITTFFKEKKDNTTPEKKKETSLILQPLQKKRSYSKINKKE